MNKCFVLCICLFVGSTHFGMEQDQYIVKKRKINETSYSLITKKEITPIQNTPQPTVSSSSSRLKDMLITMSISIPIAIGVLCIRAIWERL